MAAFKLGATDITAAYLGTQGICIINDGADTVFDAACGAQFTVTHTVSDGISGSGYTISTAPSSSITGSTGDAYSFTTTVSADSNYEFTSGPTISPSQPVTGVIGSANSTVNTTVTGTVQVIYNPQNVTATYNLDDQILGSLPGGYTVTPPTNQTQTGLANPTFSYDFTPGFAITLTSPGYEWSGGNPPTITGLTGTISSSQTRNVTISNATVVKTQYQVTGTQTNNISGPSAGYNLTFDGSSITSTGDTNVIKQGTVTDADWSFVTTLTGPNAGYNASQALSLSSGSTTGAWGDGTTPVTSVSTGTVALNPPNAISIGNRNALCANDACINPGTAQTWYYFGALATAILRSGSDGASGSYKSAGLFSASGGSSAITVGSGGVVSSSGASCYSSVSYIQLGDGGNSVTACNDTLNDYFYVTGSTNPQAMNGVWNTSNGCTPAGADFYSDGTSWNQTNSSGLVINVGSC